MLPLSTVDELSRKLAEAEETLQAIRQGEVDAVVVKGASGPQVYTLLNADRPYRNIVERMQEGAFTLTPDGTILYVNQRLASFLGLAMASIVGQKFEKFVVAADRDLFNRLVVKGNQSGGKGEMALLATNGVDVPVYLSVVDLPDEGQSIISGIATDLRWQRQRMQELTENNLKLATALAERDQAEAMLRHAHKMEAVGQLTAGVAHDFNNLLLVIGGNLELFHIGTEDKRLKGRIEASQRAIERGAHLIQQLLSFASRQYLRPCPVSVNALLRDMEPLLRSSLGEGIRLSLLLGDDLGSCVVDSTELQAAMLNLAANARDAMPRGGSLTITTEDAEFGVPMTGKADSVRACRYLSIIVTDNGHGMSPEIRERAFDPFFTTKELDKGTGLGLSRVYGFMRQSGGHVTIESATGAGTSVRLFIPWTKIVAAAPEQEVPVKVSPSASGAHRVLVVEDERGVRELVVDVLEDFGFLVNAADSGPAALSLLDSGLTVDLVFSDVLMPEGMSGFELAREIRRRLPRLPILLTSGMTGLQGVEEDTSDDLPMLRKPYKVEDLLQAIEAALDAAYVWVG